MSSLVRYFYMPTMLLGLNGLAFYVVSTGQSYWWLGALLLAGIVCAYAAEHISPFHAEWNESHHDEGSTTIHALYYETSNICGVLMMPLFAWLVPWQGIWPHDWPLIVQLLIAIAFADFMFTLIHWLSHRWAVLWRLHAVHHGVPRLHGLNGLVRHPLHQAVDMIFGTLPLVLLGMSVEVALLLGFAISIQLLVQHSNVDYELGPFENWFSIGKLHHLHHVNWGTEGDCNYGLFFTTWDRMLGTFRPDPPRPIAAGDMGIDEVPDFPAHNYLRQLIFPFIYTPGSWRTETEPKPVERTAPDPSQSGVGQSNG